jgi:hypothetical protein
MLIYIMTTRFSYGPAASNLYLTKNGSDYTLTFDYAFNSVYFRKNIDNLIDLNLFELDLSMINELSLEDKESFKNMLTLTKEKTKNFTFCNIPKFIPIIEEVIGKINYTDE